MPEMFSMGLMGFTCMPMTSSHPFLRKMAAGKLQKIPPSTYCFPLISVGVKKMGTEAEAMTQSMSSPFSKYVIFPLLSSVALMMSGYFSSSKVRALMFLERNCL